jgi:predicted DNA-binding transcriptional regulator AlpA
MMMEKNEMGDADFPDEMIESLADALWARITGAHCDPIELNLRAKLALEMRLTRNILPPFGLDKLSTVETAAYLGCEPETLRDKTKRKSLGLPQPYSFGRKLHWRRSELDPWIETQRGGAA